MGLTKPRAHQLEGSDYKASVRVVTVANVTLSGGAPTSVDGVTLVANDRVLVTAQSTGSQNGIYRVKTLGTGSNGTWVRSKDADTNDDVTAGMVVMVTEGTTYADTQWKLTTNDAITVGTTSLTFSERKDDTSVAGSDTQVQFNDGGSLAGDSGLVFNKTTDALTVTGNVTGGNLITSAAVESATVTASGNITSANLTVSDIATYNTVDSSNSNLRKINQRYTGAASGSYFSQNEYQKVVTITPSADSQNYQISGRVMAQSAGSIQIIEFDAALRSETLPSLAHSQTYSERHNGTAFFKPQLWVKETTTCLLYTSPSPRDLSTSRMPSSA